MLLFLRIYPESFSEINPDINKTVTSICKTYHDTKKSNYSTPNKPKDHLFTYFAMPFYAKYSCETTDIRDLFKKIYIECIKNNKNDNSKALEILMRNGKL